MAQTIGSDDTEGTPPFRLVTPRKDAAMQDMTTDELAELLAQLELSTEDSRDELLTDFLVRPYPTKVTQDN
ncbi:hypothetical protein DSM104299_02369 [Baekduia alba]|nr:hypothetical protein DSM104299_02369 [Baekduia alba]